jgi:hypothetical protein
MANLVLNGRSIDTIDEIAENFVEEDILREFKSGSLAAWLEEYDYGDELERVKSIKTTASNARIVTSIADALNLDDDVIAENAARREEQQRKEEEARKAREEKQREESELQTVRLLSEKDDRKVDTHDKVQLWEGGPYWATTNIGAEKPEDSGYYFWWGDTVGYKLGPSKWVASDGSDSNFSFEEYKTPTFYKSISILQSKRWIISKDGTYVLAPEHDAAQKHWGSDWRMPTEQEFDELSDMCDWTWTKVKGVDGYIVKGRGVYASNSIFLPCAGDGRGASLNYAGSYGSYWSSVPYSDANYAWYLTFLSGYHYTGSSYHYYGRSVRPLQGFSK